MQSVRNRLVRSQPTNLHQDLSSCSHVFMRQESVQSPLQRPCQGPFRILHKSDKVLSFELERNINNLLIDHLKWANMLSYFNIAAFVTNWLRNPPADEGIATVNSPLFSGRYSLTL